jgi:DNA-binding NtrC family response regulator/tetratricopeptide (TPR) repeat protein
MPPVVDEMSRLLGQSPAIEAVRASIKRVVAQHLGGHRLPPVLIQGETGSGKGLVASILHRTGPRAGGPFVDVNCAAIPDTLLEAELFGFERGAFTDAKRAKPGLFQTAHGGTIFLDEIGLLPEALQAKLLKVLEERTVRRLGSTRPEPADAWVISATNADLSTAVRERRFRADLYHRLAVLTLALPPLRARGGDILLLADRFLDQVCADYGLPPKRFSAEAQARLTAYPWPGNVRELANVIERVVLLSEGNVVTRDALGTLAEPATPAPASPPAPPPEPTAPRRPGPAMTHDEAMRQHHLAVLEQTGWNLSRAATVLEISRNTLRARIGRFGLHPPGAAAAGSPSGADRTTLPAEEVRSVRTSEAHPGPPPEARAPTIRWERRWVTFVRAQIEEPEPSGELWLRTSGLDLAVEKVLGFGGRLEALGQTRVDASFGIEPLDEAPRRAALAALAILKAAERSVVVAGRASAVRIAVHTSEQLVARVAGTYQIGRESEDETSPVLDALLGGAAPGAIVASPAAEAFLARRFRLEPGDRPEGSRAASYRLLGPYPASLGLQWRGGGFVGRRQELDLLRSRWASAIRGHGQVVALVGEPGVGKSRLLWEFTRSPDARPGLLLETGSMAVSRGTPYFPVIDLLRTYVGLEAGEDAEAARSRVTAKVLGLDETLKATLPALLALLDVGGQDPAWEALDPRQRQARFLDAVKRLLVRESRERPVLIVFEDTHWVDSETQAVLDALVDGLQAARILLLVSYRPEYQHRWGNKSAYTQLRVDPLPAEDAGELLRGLVGERESRETLEALRGLLIEWTEGNPFFLEESVRALVETGALTGERGAYRLARPVKSLQVPGTVQELLVTRMDRLPEEEKRLLQVASVVGKDVPLAVLARVAGTPAESLEPRLHRLQGAEFLYEQGSSADPEYTFRHALTHEVAYATLLEADRRAVHVQVLDAMESLYASRLPERVEALGHHALHGQVWDKAVDYLSRAGAKAFGHSANREAVSHFEQALTALRHLPAGRQPLELAVDLRFQLRNALQPLGEFQAMRDHLLEAQAAAAALGDTRRLGQASAYLSDHYRLTGDHASATRWAERALDIAGDLRDVRLEVTANGYLGQISLTLGDYRTAIPFFQRNIAALTGDLVTERFGQPQLLSVHSRTCLTWCLAELGEFAEGLERGEEGVRIAEALDHPLTRVTAYAGIGYLHVLRGDVEPALAVLEPAVRLTREGNSPLWFPRVASALGHAYALAGRIQDAIGLLEEAVSRARTMKLVSGRAFMVGILSEARMQGRQGPEALELAHEALRLAQDQNERGHEAWIRWLLGRLALERAAPPDLEQALGYLRESLEAASELGMRPLLARAHLALGRAHARSADRAAAQRDLGTAASLLREMTMLRWLPEAEAELRALG